MGTMRSFEKCNPNRDYTYIELLERAVSHDYDFLDDIIQNGTETSKENFVEVAKRMESNCNDSMSDWGSDYLVQLGYDRCPCCSEFVPKDFIDDKYKEDK